MVCINFPKFFTEFDQPPTKVHHFGLDPYSVRNFKEVLLVISWTTWIFFELSRNLLLSSWFSFCLSCTQAFLHTERGRAARLDDFASALLIVGQKVGVRNSLKVWIFLILTVVFAGCENNLCRSYYAVKLRILGLVCDKEHCLKRQNDLKNGCLRQHFFFLDGECFLIKSDPWTWLSYCLPCSDTELGGCSFVSMNRRVSKLLSFCRRICALLASRNG